MDKVKLSIDAAKAKYIADQQALLAGWISRGWEITRVVPQVFDGCRDGVCMTLRKRNDHVRVAAPCWSEAMAMACYEIQQIEHQRERELA